MIWKKINILGCDYSVSDTGLVRSNERYIIRSNGRKQKVRERILKPAVDSCGYERVALSINKKLVTKKVHRLVADAFCEKYVEYKEVNHIDGNKLNNNASNLEWCTRSENQQHAFDNGLQKPLRGSKNPSSKIDEMQCLTIKTLIKSRWSLSRISREMNISRHIPKDINRNKTWKHINV